MLQYLHFFLFFQLIICSCLVFLSHNPINSVLFLILSFINAASILLIFNADFLGILFIMIYVGAIAVLFLFVVMMLNVKIYVLNSFYTLFFYFISCLIAFFYIFSNINLTFFDLILEPTISFNYNFDNLSNIDIFGQSLYNNYLSCFLLAGLVLLVAMVGAIILTLNFSSLRKNELVERQLSRSDNFLTFYK